MSFAPLYALKDGMVWLVALVVYLFIACVYPNLLGDAENFIPANPLVTPVHIKPEWYFLFAYAILRCIPSKTLRVLALAAAVAVPIILAVGYTSTATVSFALLALTFSLLTVVGGMAIVKHYFLMSQCLSLMYFFLVTVLS
jgi:ubiquinol-cytochrome c reductase cytochrome b subunit